MNFKVCAPAFLLLGLSAAAAADVCTTQSAGLVFFGDNPDSTIAAGQATDQCHANPFATAAECDQKLDCSPGQSSPYPSGVIGCATQSQGAAYQAQGTDINQVSSDAVSQCQSAQGANSAECTAGLSCFDAGGQSNPPTDNPPGGTTPPAPVTPPVTTPPVTVEPYVYCATESRGLLFRSEGYGQNEVASTVIGACVQNPSANANECSLNISCASTPEAVRVPAPPVAPPIVIGPIPRPPVIIGPRPPIFGPRPPIFGPRPPVVIGPRPMPPRPMPPRPPVFGPAPRPPVFGPHPFPGGGPHGPHHFEES